MKVLWPEALRQIQRRKEGNMKLRRNLLKTALLAATVAPLSCRVYPCRRSREQGATDVCAKRGKPEGGRQDPATGQRLAANHLLYGPPGPRGGAHHDGGLPEGVDRCGRPEQLQQNPPNATLSVYEPGKESNTLTVVEISQPVIEGRDLVYRYKVIEGKVPATGGATSLFIDWIGPGGGVGPGFHGVGVGRRGVGWR